LFSYIITEGDPHFSVPLLSKDVLCYSIQGYSGLAINLINNEHFVINALFVDTEGVTVLVRPLGLAVIPHGVNISNAVVFDSVNQEIVVVGKENLKASTIKKIIFSANGTMNFSYMMQKNNGNPVISVIYTKQRTELDVTFYKNHLDVDWSLNYDEVHESHGLMGKSFANKYILVLQYYFML